MSLVVNNLGERILLAWMRAILDDDWAGMLGGADPRANVYLGLFKNDRIPTKTEIGNNYQEADFDGYAPQLLQGFINPGTDGAGKAFMTAPPFTFEADSGSQSIYGYLIYVEALGTASLIAAERDPLAPITVAPGSPYVVTPRLKLHNP